MKKIIEKMDKDTHMILLLIIYFGSIICIKYLLDYVLNLNFIPKNYSFSLILLSSSYGGLSCFFIKYLLIIINEPSNKKNK